MPCWKHIVRSSGDSGKSVLQYDALFYCLGLTRKRNSTILWHILGHQIWILVDPSCPNGYWVIWEAGFVLDWSKPVELNRLIRSDTKCVFWSAPDETNLLISSGVMFWSIPDELSRFMISGGMFRLWIAPEDANRLSVSGVNREAKFGIEAVDADVGCSLSRCGMRDGFWRSRFTCCVGCLWCGWFWSVLSRGMFAGAWSSPYWFNLFISGFWEFSAGCCWGILLIIGFVGPYERGCCGCCCCNWLFTSSLGDSESLWGGWTSSCGFNISVDESRLLGRLSWSSNLVTSSRLNNDCLDSDPRFVETVLPPISEWDWG